MNRSTMRTLLQRRISEPVGGDQWSDSDLNSILNEGCHLVQKEIMKLDPHAFIEIDTAPTVNGQNLYAKPTGLWYEHEVGIKGTGGSTWEPYNRIEWSDTRLFPIPVIRRDDPYDQNDYERVSRGYVNVGRYFWINPAPTDAVADGLRVVYVPTVEMGEDTDVPAIHQALHMAVVVWAQRLILGETHEDIDKVKDELRDLLGDLPEYYKSSAGRNQNLRVEWYKEY